MKAYEKCVMKIPRMIDFVENFSLHFVYQNLSIQNKSQSGRPYHDKTIVSNPGIPVPKINQTLIITYTQKHILQKSGLLSGL